MRSETIEKYEQAKALIKQGMKMRDAIKKVHMSSSSYYNVHDGNIDGAEIKKKPGPKLKAHVFADMPRKPASAVSSATNVAVIFCAPDQLQNVLQNLKGH